MSNLPTSSSDEFTWKNGRATGYVEKLGTAGLPRDGFYMRSARTGKVGLFLPDDGANTANEFFDGEGTAYICWDQQCHAMIWNG